MSKMEAIITVPIGGETLVSFLLLKKCEGQGQVEISVMQNDFDNFFRLVWPDDTFYLNWYEWLFEMKNRNLISGFELMRKGKEDNHIVQ